MLSNLLRDGVKVTRHFHKVKFWRATPSPATILRCTLQQKKFEASASPRRTSRTQNEGRKKTVQFIVLRQIDASRSGAICTTVVRQLCKL